MNTIHQDEVRSCWQPLFGRVCPESLEHCSELFSFGFWPGMH